MLIIETLLQSNVPVEIASFDGRDRVEGNHFIPKLASNSSHERGPS